MPWRGETLTALHTVDPANHHDFNSASMRVNLFMSQYRVARYLRIASTRNVRGLASLSNHAISTKPSGDISSIFPSLSGVQSAPLPPRFADVKSRLINGHEDAIRESWVRLLSDLQKETEIIRAASSAIVPELAFSDLNNLEKRANFKDQFHKRGVAVIKGVVTEKEALEWKELLKKNIQSNPSIRGFPRDKPAVYELYWAPSQVLARAHPNLLKAQAFLMSHWHCANKLALISTTNLTSYADRFRIRPPGDAAFALGPHVDAGSCERWEEEGYGRGEVYKNIFCGEWEKYDPWESSCRLPVVSDLYNGPGACSMFRMFQGWLSMSETAPGEGTLMVNPLFGKATAYLLLRPFFEAKQSGADVGSIAFLDPDNWTMEKECTPSLQGAAPSTCQELSNVLHPHLRLDDTMVHVPKVQPGDYVAWHCDTIHAVDKTHAGAADSSVMYIPACPLTENNAKYLVRQREAFLQGTPAPDFPSGPSESEHLSHLTPDYVMANMSPEGQRAIGLAPFVYELRRGISEGERKMLSRANEILGFQ